MTRLVLRSDTERTQFLLKQYSDVVAIRRRDRLMLGAGLLICSLVAAWAGEVDLQKFWSGLPRFGNYIYDITPALSWATLGQDLANWYWNWDGWLALLAETLLVAYLGTFLGAVIGFALCFLGSANLMKHTWVRFIVRRFLEFCRTVPDIVFALLLVYAMGLGPIPGVLAIAIHTAGALGKQFSEVVENIDPKPVDGLISTGASWVEQIRFAVVPQVYANFISYTLLRFEINVRGASVMGFVGAGGIGKELLGAIRQFYYSDVSAILLMIIVTVVILDMLTAHLRHRFHGTDLRHGIAR